MPIPKLIFAEIHDDLVTMELLRVISPKLQELGYNCFLDEIPTSMTLTTLNELLDGAATEYSQLKEEIHTLGYQEFNNESIKALSKKYSVGFFTVSEDNFKLAIKKHEIGSSLKKLLTALAGQNIKWKGIDPLQEQSVLDIAEYDKLQEIRDKSMVEEYLQNDAVFGRTGLAHLPGIQKNIIEEIGEEQAQESFCFFHIYTGELYKEYPKDLPLNVTIINANNMTHTEIVEQIIRHINQTQEHGKSAGPNI